MEIKEEYEDEIVIFPLRIHKSVLGVADIISLEGPNVKPVCQYIEEATKEKILKDKKEKEIKVNAIS